MVLFVLFQRDILMKFGERLHHQASEQCLVRILFFFLTLQDWIFYFFFVAIFLSKCQNVKITLCI